MPRLNRIERRRLNETAVLGISLTLLVLAADYFGLLKGLDDWAYDRRVRSCQTSSQPPSNQIVHLDVDDRALEVIGRWPWPRARFAALLDEVQIAGPKVVGMDVLFSEAEEPANDTATDEQLHLSPGDSSLATTLQKSGNTVIAAIFSPPDPSSTEVLPRAIRAQLTADPELTESQLIENLAAKHFGSPTQQEKIAATFLASRREAMFERVREILTSTSPPPGIDSIAAKLLKKSTAEIDSPLKRLLKEQYDRAITEMALSRFGIPIPKTASGLPISVISMAGVIGAPLPEFTRATAAVGFVDWKFLDEKVCRSIPLFVDYDHRLYPQFALVIACRMLDVDPNDIRFEKDSVIIPRPAGTPIVIPVFSARWKAAARDVPLMMDIRYFGTPKWSTNYDWPRSKESKQHISMNAVWDALATQRRIERNNAAADINLKYMLARLSDEAGIKALESDKSSLHDSDARTKIILEILNRTDTKGILETAEAFKLEELEKEDRDFVGAARVLRLIPQQNAALKSQLIEKRKELAGHLKGKAVLIGWTAIGTIADYVPTSMHESCPGVVVHGVILNAILTNRFWFPAPKWVAPLITLVAGLLTAWAAATLSPWRAAGVAAILALGYCLINGLLVFGRWNILLNVAGPVVVITLVWGACTLAHTLLEASERAHVERRFRSYVDPSLVEYVVEHAELAHMAGEIREVTVCFTDLVGFTTISERLGTKTVTLLNEYWEVMIPIVRRHHGYVAKFMGDGLFFFYGAPVKSATHCPDAVQSILEMQDALTAFNLRTAARDLPALGMRAGINTGNAVVGDAGTRDASDYTALGDTTNLGSRLEGANKGFGTRNLLTQRTADLCADRFLLRPVGKLRVVGKTLGIFTYEALCLTQAATDTDRRLVELTRPIVDLFIAARFADCLTATEALMNDSGPTKITKLYKSLCQQYITDGTPDGFDGSIVLTEK